MKGCIDVGTAQIMMNTHTRYTGIDEGRCRNSAGNAGGVTTALPTFVGRIVACQRVLLSIVSVK